MYLAINKAPQVFVQHNAMDQNYLAPVSSNFRINLDLVSQISIYTIKEPKQRLGMDSQLFTIPTNSRVIHLEMSYPHSSHQEQRGEQTLMVMERYYYKLVFLPEAEEEYLRIKRIIERQTLAD